MGARGQLELGASCYHTFWFSCFMNQATEGHHLIKITNYYGKHGYLSICSVAGTALTKYNIEILQQIPLQILLRLSPQSKSRLGIFALLQLKPFPTQTEQSCFLSSRVVQDLTVSQEQQYTCRHVVSIFFFLKSKLSILL